MILLSMGHKQWQRSHVNVELLAKRWENDNQSDPGLPLSNNQTISI
jgi:hypothetical protein